MQVSLVEASCRVTDEKQCSWQPRRSRRVMAPPLPVHPQEVMPWEEPQPWMPGRRMYPALEVSAGGSTLDQFCISPKRHCGPPSSSTNADYKGSSSMRRAVDFERMTSKAEDGSQLGGRRHVPPPPGHLAGSGSEVVRLNSHPSSKRHCEDLSARHRSASAARWSQRLLPQRRHLHAQDHLLGSSVVGTTQALAGRPKDLRRSTVSPTFSDQGAVLSLGSFAPVAESEARASSAAGPCRPRTPGRRHLEMEDHLVGSMLRGPQATNADLPSRPSRRPGLDRVSLLGASVRCESAPEASMRCPSCGPQDTLFGGTFRCAVQTMVNDP